ncbi:peptide chain release factor 1-like, mitochondrial isoform X11 [Solanum lycopersicum]|uniref:peptide chain release factor 1-like, mitochondrial isoform X11 n=2 Tax=Solanum lycopersicum TaxID=4081 RepID=UPI00374A0DEE
MKLTNKGLMDFLHAGLPATKLTDYSESALFSKIDEIIFSSEEHCRFAKGLFRSKIGSIKSLFVSRMRRRFPIFSIGRLYCTGNAEAAPQLSIDLIKIMDQRLSAIENRNAHLERFLDQEIKELKSVISDCQDDKDMQQMASEELSEATEGEKKFQFLLLKSLLPKDDADERDCILEVRAGTGGEEASLFAMDIFKMYEKYSVKKGWKYEVLETAESDLKGYKEAIASISGAGVYGKLKFESGIHRVQRVPVTEKGGRVHTSAVSVAILPQADQLDLKLRNEDLKMDTYRSGGSGGQHANTTNSAVRITHVPSGITVSIQDQRSQHMNKAKALKILCAKLYEIERLSNQSSRSKLRLEQIGSGDRSERIRTYNFPQGRVTDHRVGITTHSIDDVLQGEDLDAFIDALLLRQEMDAIASFSST